MCVYVHIHRKIHLIITYRLKHFCVCFVCLFMKKTAGVVFYWWGLAQLPPRTKLVALVSSFSLFDKKRFVCYFNSELVWFQCWANFGLYLWIHFKNRVREGVFLKKWNGGGVSGTFCAANKVWAASLSWPSELGSVFKVSWLKGLTVSWSRPADASLCIRSMLMCSCEKVDFNITSRTVARLVFEAEQDNRNGGNSSNGR